MPITELNTEQLIKNKKTIGAATAVLTGLLIVLLTLSIYNWITKGFTGLIIIPFALSPIVFVNFKRIKEIKRELKARGES